MTFKRNQLRDAINIALCVGAVSMLSMGTAFAQDAASATSTDAKAKNLDTITVTGSRVRRVESETATPVVVIDRKAIEKTGKLTIGEIVNDLPNISGAPTTTQVNNGGGTGAATAELRGLGSVRTLVLIDGHRPGPTPVDLNSIPLAMVERIEVDTTGSSTVYGSDAVAGVINFIMRKNYSGATFTANYGESGHHDAARKGQSLTFGQSGDKGNVVAGLEYNKFDALPAGRRDFSKNALYTSYGVVTAAGSSRNPFGRIFLPGDPSPLQGQFGCTSVTRKPGTSGTALGDYRCFTTADKFNFQPFNVDLSPQERVNAFALANYNLTDDVSAYMEIYHQKQTAKSVIAPLAFDANSDLVTISKDSIYNPFGADIGAGSGNEFFSRFLNIGQRILNNSTANDVVFVGLKGSFGQTWSWDAGFDYNHSFFITTPQGYPNTASLAQALGPSLVIGGVPTCVATAGDPSTAIAGCTPVNLFNLDDPNTIAQLKGALVNPTSTVSFIQREFEINASGDLFDLPAGAVKLAVGGDARREYQNNRIDPLTVISPVTGGCSLSQETCGTPLIGSFNLKEVYAELFVPILKDVPFAYALNIDLGTRYSKYNLFSGNTSNKIALEWRPIKDLLIRGNVSDVFRAPTAADLFSGGSGGAFPFGVDPCVGVTPAAGDLACGPARGTVIGQVPPGGIQSTGLRQVTGVAEGSVLGGFSLQPEQGRSYDFGFVYDPQYVAGLSVSADFYRVTLNNVIQGLTPDIALGSCKAAGGTFCSFINRLPNGQIDSITLPTVNLGSLVTSGVDMAIKYRLPAMSWGQTTISSDFTHINKYDVVLDPNSGDETLHVAGHFNRNFGNYVKWRGNVALDWSLGDWNAGYRLRWVGKGQVGDADLGQKTSSDGVYPGQVLRIPSYFESFLTAGYNFGPIGAMDSRVDVGVDNVLDKQPPIFTQTSVVNGNVDVNTYDAIGRLFWARFTAKF